jgi:hypothetical protein
MRKASASSSRTPNGRCVPVHTVSFPSCHSATAARGSIGAWAMYATVYVALTTLSAVFPASVTEPVTCGGSMVRSLPGFASRARLK